MVHLFRKGRTRTGERTSDQRRAQSSRRHFSLTDRLEPRVLFASTPAPAPTWTFDGSSALTSYPANTVVVPIPITYYDSQGINLSTITTKNLITAFASATVNSVVTSTPDGGKTVHAIYYLVAPGGSWANDSGSNVHLAMNTNDLVQNSAGTAIDPMPGGIFFFDLFSVDPNQASPVAAGTFIPLASATDAAGHELLAGTDATHAVLKRLTAPGQAGSTTYDPTFNGGAAAPDNNSVYFAVASAGQQVLVAGADGNGSFSITRFNADGSVDASFGGSQGVHTSLGSPSAAYTVAPDGGMVVAGGSPGLVRYSAAGVLDPTFGDKGIASTPGLTITQVKVESNGDIVALATSSATLSVMRFLPNGALDPAFNSGQPLQLSQIQSFIGGQAPDHNEALAVESDGSILIANHTPSEHFGLVHVTANGLIDSSFGVAGVAATSFGGIDDADQIVLTSSQIFVVGTTQSISGTQIGNVSTVVAAYRLDGTPDSAFGQNGQMVIDAPPGGSPSIGGAPFTVSNGLFGLADWTNTGLLVGNSGSLVRTSIISTVAPMAQLSNGSPITAAAGTACQFTVTYSGPAAINSSTFSSNNLVVTGPGNYQQPATFVSAGPTPGSAIYSIPAPAQNGSYSVSMQADQVADARGLFVPAGVIGALTDSAPISSPPVVTPPPNSPGGGSTPPQVGSTPPGPSEAGHASISGRVVDALTGAGIANQTVTLNTNATVSTDADGNYTFANLPAGDFTVTTSAATSESLVDPVDGSHAITLASGQAAVGLNFAEIPAGSGGGADLVATLLGTIPSSVAAGSTGNVRLRITNIGSSLAIGGPINVSLLLSQDGALSAANLPITTVSAGGIRLKSKASKVVQIRFAYPSVSAAGAYHLIAVADSSNAIAEANKSNNIAVSGAISIAPATATLSGAFIHLPEELIHGKTGRVAMTLSNSGNIAFPAPISVSLYESAETSFDAGDLFLSTVSQAKLTIKPMGHANIELRFLVPATASLGSEYLVAVINGDTAHPVVSSQTISFV